MGHMEHRMPQMGRVNPLMMGRVVPHTSSGIRQMINGSPQKGGIQEGNGGNEVIEIDGGSHNNSNLSHMMKRTSQISVFQRGNGAIQGGNEAIEGMNGVIEGGMSQIGGGINQLGGCYANGRPLPVVTRISILKLSSLGYR